MRVKVTDSRTRQQGEALEPAGIFLVRRTARKAGEQRQANFSRWSDMPVCGLPRVVVECFGPCGNPGWRRMRPRSKGSLAFEEFWRSLRSGTLVPSRADFKPSRAARFLHNIILLEAPGEGRDTLKVRLAGHLYQSVVQYSVSGTDHLDLLPPEYHAGALASVRLMAAKPCGLWQVMPVYLRGYSRLVEFTAFPLSPGEDCIPLILGYLVPLDEVGLAAPALRKEISVDTAVDFLFIDVGAGEPKWPADSGR